MRLIATISLLPLAACVVTPEPNTDISKVCKDDGLASFVGQDATADLGSRLRSASGAKTLRWVPKGGVVTMDFRPDRLTVQLDADNKVETARCG